MTKEEPPKGARVEVDRLPNCDMCYEDKVITDAAYDARTRMGPWAYMCPAHFQRCGVGLGTGLGQLLVVKKNEER